jgi:hypothetical protein
VVQVVGPEDEQTPELLHAWPGAQRLGLVPHWPFEQPMQPPGEPQLASWSIHLFWAGSYAWQPVQVVVAWQHPLTHDPAAPVEVVQKEPALWQ